VTVRNLKVQISLDASGVPQSAVASYLVVGPSEIQQKTLPIANPDWTLPAKIFWQNAATSVAAIEAVPTQEEV